MRSFVRSITFEGLNMLYCLKEVLECVCKQPSNLFPLSFALDIGPQKNIFLALTYLKAKAFETQMHPKRLNRKSKALTENQPTSLAYLRRLGVGGRIGGRAPVYIVVSL